jgi:hypothetical protein
MIAENNVKQRSDGLQTAPDLAVEPSPWALTGDGWVVFYWFTKAVLNQAGIERPELRGKWRGGLGALTWMNYHTSPVGPYGEIMFIPGQFDFGIGRYFSIGRIYVSSWESVVSGRANWGIPKDRADFHFETWKTGEEHLTATLDGENTPFAELLCRPSGWSAPASTRLLPIQMAQVWEGQIFVTTLTLRARVHWLDVLSVKANNAHFPSTNGFTPLGAVKLANFEITFPVAKVSSYAN